jgi:hypothetical protein
LRINMLLTELSHVVQERAEGPKAPSQGIALGIMVISKAPCKGDKFVSVITQGDALG